MLNLKVVGLVLGFVGTLTFSSRVEREYMMKANVVQVNGDEVVAVDLVTGDEWVFFDDELVEGQQVMLKMDNMNTRDKTDDEVIGVRVVK